MTKIKCPICGIEGFLEKRGNSYRVKHYKGYINKKRIYVTHMIPSSLISTTEIVTNLSDQSNNNLLMGINGNQIMGIKGLNLGFNQEKNGPVVQSGMNAALARRRPRVQIPPGPPKFLFHSDLFNAF